MKYPKFDSMEDMMAFYYGSPSTLIRKVTDTLVDQTVGAGTHWEPLYGKKAWSWLNLEANPFAIIPKEPWQKTGWRILQTAAWSTTGGRQDVTQVGSSIGTPAVLTFDEIYAKPKLVSTPYEVGEQQEIVSNIDDAVPLLAFYREEVAKEHTFTIAQDLCVEAETTPASTTYGFETIDRVVSSNAEAALFSAATDADIYSQAFRSNNTAWDAQVTHNSDSDRDLTLTLIDTVQENVLTAGGQPKVILTRHNTKNRWQQLLEAERRFMQAARVIPTFGGVRSVMGAGVEAGFMVATYQGVPILESQHVFIQQTLGSIYFLDTDYLKIAVAKPTTLIESGFDSGMIDRGYFTAKGTYETMGELRAYAFKFHGKLRDLQ